MKKDFLVYLKNKDDELYADLQTAYKEAEEYASDESLSSDSLDLMIEDCTRQYNNEVAGLISYALDRGCDPEDLYPIFGEYPVNMVL